ncbi:MAG: glycosyltransferase family 4 protein [bacterium]|nr:glycosyltransferase family 4 protein [bacterium]
MRIAFLCYRGNMQSGGQGIYLHALTRRLAQMGHEIDVFVGPPYPDPMPWANEFRIENQMFWGSRFKSGPGAFLPQPDPLRIFHPLNFFEYAVSRFGFLPEPFAFSVRAARQVLARIREGVRYELVHDVQSVGYGLLGLQAIGLPVVTMIHHPLSVDRRSSLQRDRTFEEFKGSLTFYPVRTQARVARRLAGVLTSSEVSADAIENDFGVSRARIHNVHNGVDLPDPGVPRTRPEAPQLLFIGRCGDPNKGLEYLISALALLPPEVSLRVLDAFPENTPMENQIDDLHLRERIHFEGKLPRKELEAVFRESAITVLPSLFEGFGLPAIEALAAGTPVVATRAGALPEVIHAAGAGVLVEPADAADLAKGIAGVLERWEDAQREVLDARPRLEERFGWAQVGFRTEKVYEQVLREFHDTPQPPIDANAEAA